MGVFDNWGLSTGEQAHRLASTLVTEEQLSARHLSSLEVFKTQRSEALTLGSLGLAAWAVLTGTSARGQLNGYGLQLLLVGVALTVLGPILFRRGGTEGSRMGLETSTSVGYAAIAIALLAFLPSIFEGGVVKWLAFGVAVLLFLREAVEITTEMDRTDRLFGRPTVEAEMAE